APRGPPPAALRRRRRTPRARCRRLAGARPDPHRRAQGPGRGPAAGAPDPARRLPGPPPDGQTPAPPALPRPRAAAARPASPPQLRDLRPRLPRPRPPPLPGLRLSACRFRCPRHRTRRAVPRGTGPTVTGRPRPAQFSVRLLRDPVRIPWPRHPVEDTMSTQADHGHELIPRPEQTPDALRTALAVVDPGRLDEMQATKDEIGRAHV